MTERASAGGVAHVPTLARALRGQPADYDDMLPGRCFDALERRLRRLQRTALRSRAAEQRYVQALAPRAMTGLIARHGSALLPWLRAWQAARPHSSHAHTAEAAYWSARLDAHEAALAYTAVTGMATEAATDAAFQAAHDGLWHAASAALAQPEPCWLAACLMVRPAARHGQPAGASGQGGDAESAAAWRDAALRMAPASFEPWWQFARSQLPACGGSRDAVAALADRLPPGLSPADRDAVRFLGWADALEREHAQCRARPDHLAHLLATARHLVAPSTLPDVPAALRRQAHRWLAGWLVAAGQRDLAEQHYRCGSPRRRGQGAGWGADDADCDGATLDACLLAVPGGPETAAWCVAMQCALARVPRGSGVAHWFTPWVGRERLHCAAAAVMQAYLCLETAAAAAPLGSLVDGSDRPTHAPVINYSPLDAHAGGVAVEWLDHAFRLAPADDGGPRVGAVLDALVAHAPASPAVRWLVRACAARGDAVAAFHAGTMAWSEPAAPGGDAPVDAALAWFEAAAAQGYAAAMVEAAAIVWSRSRAAAPGSAARAAGEAEAVRRWHAALDLAGTAPPAERARLEAAVIDALSTHAAQIDSPALRRAQRAFIEPLADGGCIVAMLAMAQVCDADGRRGPGGWPDAVRWMEGARLAAPDDAEVLRTYQRLARRSWWRRVRYGWVRSRLRPAQLPGTRGALY